MKNVIIRTAILCSVATHFLDKCFPQIYKPFRCVVGKEHSRRLKKGGQFGAEIFYSQYFPRYFFRQKRANLEILRAVVKRIATVS